MALGIHWTTPMRLTWVKRWLTPSSINRSRGSMGLCLIYFHIRNLSRHPVRRGFSSILCYISLILMGSLLRCSLDLVHPLPNPQSVQVGVIYRQTKSMSAGSNNRDLRRRRSYVATQSRFPCSLLVFRSKPICFKSLRCRKALRLDLKSLFGLVQPSVIAYITSQTRHNTVSYDIEHLLIQRLQPKISLEFSAYCTFSCKTTKLIEQLSQRRLIPSAYVSVHTYSHVCRSRITHRVFLFGFSLNRLHTTTARRFQPDRVRYPSSKPNSMHYLGRLIDITISYTLLAAGIWQIFTFLTRLYDSTVQRKTKINTSVTTPTIATAEKIEPLPDFQYETVTPIKYRPFETKRHVAMGMLRSFSFLPVSITYISVKASKSLRGKTGLGSIGTTLTE